MSEMVRLIYFPIVFLSMLFAFYRIGISRLSVLIILVFWEGLFNYLGDITNPFFQFNLYNVYKIFIVLYAFYLVKAKFNASNKNELRINTAFIIFTISFWLSYYINDGEIITILSQYFYKFGLVFILYHYFKNYLNNLYRIERLKRILLIVLYIQIALSIIKIIFVGFGVEKVTGSMSAGGAGIAVVSPIIFLIFYWLIKGGNFKRTDWIISILILIIALASNKRQPVIFYPVVLFTLFVYVKKDIRIYTLVKYLPLVLIIFYLGIRLTPSFTPENKTWGKFDLNYVRNYSLSYYFGTSNEEEIFSENYDYSGRGGGVTYYFQPQKLNLISLEELLFGKGLYEVAVRAHGRFTATSRSDYGISHSGLIGEAGALLYSIGYLGTLSLVLLAVFIIRTIKNKRLALVLLLFFLWDFLFYYNQVIFNNQSAIIVLFIIFYTNTINVKKNPT